MGNVRRCDNRCHSAKGTRCACWCGGKMHGKNGAINREALAKFALEPEKQKEFLEAHGFKQGETAYIEQNHLPEPSPPVTLNVFRSNIIVPAKVGWPSPQESKDG